MTNGEELSHNDELNDEYLNSLLQDVAKQKHDMHPSIDPHQVKNIARGQILIIFKSCSCISTYRPTADEATLFRTLTFSNSG